MMIMIMMMMMMMSRERRPCRWKKISDDKQAY